MTDTSELTVRASQLPAGTALGSNLDTLREHNAWLVLDLIRRRPGVTAATAARTVGLTRQAVSKIVGRLVTADLIRADAPAADGVGAPRIRLNVVPASRFAIGVVIDRSGWRATVVDLSGTALARRDGEYGVVPAVDLLVKAVAAAVTELTDELEILPGRVVGLGVSVVGPLDAARGVVTAANNFPGWQNVALADTLQTATGLPCRIEKDSNAAAIGEHWQDGAPTSSELVVLSGSGVGAGLIIDGALHGGATGNAGEFGHMRLSLTGPLCACGRRGCVEALTSQAAIVHAYQAASPHEPVRWTADTPALFAAITHAAGAGDVHSMQIVHDAGLMLGTAVANVVQLLDVSSVVLTGPTIRDAGDIYVQAVSDAIEQDAALAGRPAPSTRIGALGDDAVALGAAVLGFMASRHWHAGFDAV